MKMWKIGDAPTASNNPGWVSGSWALYETRPDRAKSLWPLTHWPCPHFHLGFIIANFILSLVPPSVLHGIIGLISLRTWHCLTILALNYIFLIKFSKYFSIHTSFSKSEPV
jgi:hypothetical protein